MQEPERALKSQVQALHAGGTVPLQPLPLHVPLCPQPHWVTKSKPQILRPRVNLMLGMPTRDNIDSR